MDLTQLANLGEFIGGVAVLVTLIYLAMQVRASAKTFKLSSLGSAKEQFNTVNLTVAANPELGDLWVKGASSLAGLNAGERVRFGSIAFSYFNVFERLLESRERLGSGLWEVEEQSMVTMLASMPGLVQWWEENPITFAPMFRDRVTHLIADDEQMRQARRVVHEADRRPATE